VQSVEVMRNPFVTCKTLGSHNNIACGAKHMKEKKKTIEDSNKFVTELMISVTGKIEDNLCQQDGRSVSPHRTDEGVTEPNHD
jgi:hypothetical protein